ncbi:MAG TPA: hypothetical protein VFK02_23480 [Kofleriaceae bacterium]|nr:hypothetical protein [Kofleriaceae bacterium]
MKNAKNVKLSVTREVIRVLTAARLAHVIGGDDGTHAECTRPALIAPPP